ncbi:MAG: hypothetical protein PHW79_05575 [Candidatus Marinimicrobia bacterium]|nr:hypothetical protein [Candidatus Neomarinimicrobiota bacterium]
MILIIVHQVAFSQDFGKLYQSYILKNNIKNETKRSRILQSIENSAKIHPNLIYPQIQFYNSFMVPQNDIIRIKQLTQLNLTRNGYLFRRNVWVNGQLDSLENIHLSSLKANFIRKKLTGLIQPDVEKLIDPDNPVLSDLNRINYYAYLHYARIKGLDYEPTIDYSVLRKVKENERVKRYETILEKVSQNPQNAKLTVVDSLLNDWHLFESTPESKVNPVSFMSAVYNSYWLPQSMPNLTFTLSFSYMSNNSRVWKPTVTDVNDRIFTPEITVNYPLGIASLSGTYRFKLQPQNYPLTHIDISIGYAHNIYKKPVWKCLFLTTGVDRLAFTFFSKLVSYQALRIDGVIPFIFINDRINIDIGLTADFTIMKYDANSKYQYYGWRGGYGYISGTPFPVKYLEKFIVSPVIQINLRLSKNKSISIKSSFQQQSVNFRLGW